MKKYLILATVLLTSFVSNAQAQTAYETPLVQTSNDTYFVPETAECDLVHYIPNILSSKHMYVNASVATTHARSLHRNGNHLSFKDGVRYGVALGYQFESFLGYRDAFRGELEFAYHRNNVKHSISENVSIDVNGNIHAYTLMGNIYYDFKTAGNFTPYVGAGIGYANMHARFKDSQPSVYGTNNLIHSSESWVWQVMGGVSMPITDCIDLAVEYRHCNFQKHYPKERSWSLAGNYHF